MTAEYLRMARQWLRISTDALDEELSQTMDACLIDLANAGVNNPSMESTLVQQAVKLYCKAQFGYDNDSDKFDRAYEYLKCSLALSNDTNQ